MQDILQKYRHDGKRYWFKDGHGKWRTMSAGSVATGIAIDRGIPKREAIALRSDLREASTSVRDQAWREAVEWLDFTKGRHLCLAGDKVEFCDPRTGWSKKSMKILAFNRVLKAKFPSKPEIAAEGGFAFLAL